MQQTLHTLCAVTGSSHCVVETTWAGRRREGVILVKTQLSISCILSVKSGVSTTAVLNGCVWCTTLTSAVVSTQGTEGSFGIDNEEHEAMPVEVKLLPRKLRFFCDPSMRGPMLRAAVHWEFMSKGTVSTSLTRVSSRHTRPNWLDKPHQTNKPFGYFYAQGTSIGSGWFAKSQRG